MRLTITNCHVSNLISAPQWGRSEKPNGKLSMFCWRTGYGQGRIRCILAKELCMTQPSVAKLASKCEDLGEMPGIMVRFVHKVSSYRISIKIFAEFFCKFWVKRTVRLRWKQPVQTLRLEGFLLQRR